jgi:hypothetical protein
LYLALSGIERRRKKEENETKKRNKGSEQEGQVRK